MSGLVFLLWFGNVLFDTAGQLAFKAAAAAPDKKPAPARKNGIGSYWLGLLHNTFLWLGIGAYAAEFLLWLAFLTLVPLSEGVLLGSVNIIIIMILARFLFNEKLTPLRLIGIGLVALGVAAVGAF